MGKRYRGKKMDKQRADELIVKYLKKIYGFATKKTFSYQEAEELSSDIVAEVYMSFLSAREEVENTDGYIWSISQRVYSKFVSAKKRRNELSLDAVDIPDDTPELDDEVKAELALLRREVAYLTRTRRDIVYSFYYEDRPISAIASEMGIPEGTVKWHLNKARDNLKEGFSMERKIGRLGIRPITATSFGHGGNPGNNSGPEYYLGNKLNLNIVYSVYHEPKTLNEIAEELGITPVYIEDTVNMLEENGFLVKQAGKRYTTYVMFNPETYSLELRDRRLQKQKEVAELLVREYVPLVRESVADVKDIYIPNGNRQLFEASAVFCAVGHRCGINTDIDRSQYCIKTKAGGDFIAHIHIPETQIDPDYIMSQSYPAYWACGDMNRWSEKYPSVYSWSVDTRYCSRQGAWSNNLTSDYEYLYEFITGAIEDTPANKEKFDRLRSRKYLTDDNKVNIMVMRGDKTAFFSKLPELSDELKRTFADYALEHATRLSANYPPQMRDLAVAACAESFVGGTVALMVMDILYGNGTFSALTENERVTSNLIMFCDKLPI